MSETRRYLDEEGLMLLWTKIKENFSYKLESGDYIDISEDDIENKIEVKCTIGDNQGVIVGNGLGEIYYIQFTASDNDKILKVQLNSQGIPELVWDNFDPLPDMDEHENEILSNDGSNAEWINLQQNAMSLIIGEEDDGKTTYAYSKLSQSANGLVQLENDDELVIGKGVTKIRYTDISGSVNEIEINANAVNDEANEYQIPVIRDYQGSTTINITPDTSGVRPIVSVITTNEATQGDNRPITSNGVYNAIQTTIGDIEIALQELL